MSVTASPIRRVLRAGTIPPSVAQERLWFLDQLESSTAVYGVSWGLRLRGLLNVVALERSLREIVRRHEVLRTRFSMVDGSLEGVVHDPTEFSLSATDLRKVPDQDREAEARRLVKVEADQPLELSRGLQLRVRRIQLADDEHWLILTMHQVTPDETSMEILHRELAALYEAFADGRSSPLPELPVQYVDYGAWQRAWLQDEALDEQLSFWKRQLSGAPARLELPTDYPRPALPSYRGAVEEILLDETLSRALRDLSQREGVTLFMTLMAAFQVLLSRYSGQEDVSVGTVVAGRSRAELEGLIGLFANMLVFRQDLSANPTFRELLARVRDFTNAAFAHGECPFGKVVEELQPPRSLSASPLFQVMLVLKNAQQSTLRIPNLEISPLTIHNGRAQFDLTLTLVETDQGLQGTMEYNTELFNASTIRRMLEHLRVLLESIVVDPGRRIGELPLLAEAERGQLLVDWNDSDGEQADTCIHELFEAQVERTPDAVAVESDGRQLTYSELNVRANQLAHHLVGLGIGPEKLVGLCVNRSPEMLIGLLGILKAGGAYVPMDPHYPKERIAFMLKDSQTPVLLTHRALLDNLPLHAAKVVCLDSDLPEMAPEVQPARAAGPRNLAYVIYTSGSTGTPKGVAIEHRSTVTFIKWAQSVFTAEELSGVLASTSVCFDLSVYEFFVPLSSGGRVILVENVLDLVSARKEANVKLINTVPSAIAELLRRDAVPSSVVTVNLAGEPLSTDLVNAIYAQTRAKRVYDLYGPTEDTTYSTFALRLPEMPATIGRPIDDTQAFVLDKHLQPVPIGVPGELHLGGRGLARGYLNRPELTADKFIANPFPGASGDRLYKTGDLVRYRSDGNLEYFGRLDHQVKIRGFRIELGEIESRLRSHPSIQDVVVTAREDSPGEKRLVAYLVPTNGDAASITNLRDYLTETLPDYMVPPVFMTLDALPLTPNGKVDRKALPAPEKVGGLGSCDWVAPRTPIEMELVRILSDVLKATRLGVHDDFFDLGGDSLMATEAILRMRKAFAVDLPLRSLFEAPTVAQMALLIRPQPVASTNGKTSPTTRPRLGGEEMPIGEDTLLFTDDTPAGGLILQGRALDPLDFSEIMRTGDGGAPLVCVGDSRPIFPMVLKRKSPHIPVFQLKIDGGHVWPPRYLTVEDQLETHVRALESLCPRKKATILGFSYSGILAYRLGVALLERGWPAVSLILIEPEISSRFLRSLKFRSLIRRSKRVVANLILRSPGGTHPKSDTHQAAFPKDLPPVPENPDAQTRFSIMDAHFRNNINSIEPVVFRGKLGLVGCESYQASYSKLWQGLTSAQLAQCVFPNTNDHFACLSEPYNEQLLDFVEQWCNQSSAS
jgi:amino acid adenylation domain-containing protein